jgi:TrmH family RNA methyltransferase
LIIFIESSENKIIKHAKKLSKANFRKKCGEFLAEGKKIVLEAIKFAPGYIKFLVVSKTFFDLNEQFLKKLPSEFKLYIVSDKIFSEITSLKTPEGIFAVCKTKEFLPAESLKSFNFLLILDGIQNPGSMGTILRTAEAAGTEATVLTDNTADVWNAKSVRGSAGSIFRMNFCKLSSPKILKDFGFRILVTSLKDSVDLRRANFSGKIAIAVGNEARGVSAKLLEIADEKIKIPMQGEVESLSAPQAAGILLYFASFSRGG